MEMLIKFIIGLVVFSAIALLGGIPLLRLLNNNKKKVLRSKELAEDLDHNIQKQNIVINQFSFALSTFPCSLSIRKIRTIFIEASDRFSDFLGIEAISEPFSDYFLLTGSFMITRIKSGQRNSFFDRMQEDFGSFNQYYDANILFKRNDNASLVALLSAQIPEDRDHDLLIKDFVTRLKDILK